MIVWPFENENSTMLGFFFVWWYIFFCLGEKNIFVLGRYIFKCIQETGIIAHDHPQRHHFTSFHTAPTFLFLTER